jgi:LytS/YehU family sensor histidine kinase
MELSPLLNGQQVYPLLFLPLVENAFKYAGDDFISIAARGDEKEIVFEVKNSIPSMAIPGKAGGIGLKNLERRLTLLYPGKHSFRVEQTGNIFTASLKLML